MMYVSKRGMIFRGMKLASHTQELGQGSMESFLKPRMSAARRRSNFVLDRLQTPEVYPGKNYLSNA
jgi:hypothetical protein